MAAKKKGKLGGGGGAPDGDQDLLYSAQQIWQAGLGALSAHRPARRRCSTT